MVAGFLLVLPTVACYTILCWLTAQQKGTGMKYYQTDEGINAFYKGVAAFEKGVTLESALAARTFKHDDEKDRFVHGFMAEIRLNNLPVVPWPK